ncbi:15256_t:CDS:10 [Acaulospora colombiana]|uniref:15256_t:CDS:1 n=1 Tax=Acaulospora colombiana TaxID=27376 RepID=A0ACA9JY34_9GLOM|nr:15256_t:CDS:10 [Acaulospora colombiana]
MTNEDRVKEQRRMWGIKVDQSSIVSDARPVKRTRLEQDASNSYGGSLPLSPFGRPIVDRGLPQILRPGPEVFTVSPRPSSCDDERNTLKFNQELLNNFGGTLSLSPSTNSSLSTPNFQQRFILMSPAFKAGQIIDPVNFSPEAKCLPSTVSAHSLQTQRISLPETSAPKETIDETNRNLCWGMIETLALILYERRNGGHEEEEEVQLKREVTAKNKGQYTMIRVTKDGEPFGVVKQEMANVLAPLMDEKLIWTEAFIRNSAKEMMIPLRIIIYGPPKNTEAISTHLYERGVLLSKPVVFNCATRYLNPHDPPLRGSQLSKKNAPGSYGDHYHGGSSTTTTRTSKETKNQIDKHQKQALYFLLEREKYNDFTDDETNALTSLWRTRTSAGRLTVYYNVVTNDETKSKPVQMRGGIVADDMGLGKTIQIIALVLGTQKEAIEFSQRSSSCDSFCAININQSSAQSKSDFGFDVPTMKSRGTLIVCPLSTVSNWEDQLTHHVQQGSLSFYVYHGGARISDPSLLIDYDIVITTYNVSGSEFSRESKNKIPSALQRIHWFRVVLDEAHIIKDVATIQSKAACSLKAERRWCLTGTPIQNKADDLFALVKFLHMVPFNIKENWTSYILRPIRSFDPVGISRLQTLMKCITLRRTKMINGKSLLSLPPRNDHIRYLELSEYERRLYKMHFAQLKQFERLEENNIMRHYANILQSLLRLRQICAHFALVKETELRGNFEVENGASGLTSSKAMTILNVFKESGMDQCGSCMQELTQRSVVTKCEHLFCMECAARVMSEILNFGSDKTVACPLCGLELGSSDVIEVSDDVIEVSDSKDYEDHLSRANPDRNSHSTKVKALIGDLVQAKIDGIKSVVFSQWTRMLDLIEDALIENNIMFTRLDGAMTRAERTQNMETFRKQDDVGVILISLKAGGVGLNLTVAQRVYLMDPFWNPSVENQAIDRIHRLGQTCTVDTFSALMFNYLRKKDSVEETILKLQERKLQLAELTLSEKLSKQEITRRRIEDLISLFK